MRTALSALMLVLSSAAWAQLPDSGDTPESSDAGTPEPKTLATCTQGLPALRTPMAFAPGELLEFDLDAQGIQAGKLTMRVQRPKNGTLPIQVEVKTNTFFSKIRRVKATAMSYLHPRTLRPGRYTEDAQENQSVRSVEVLFDAKAHKAKLDYVNNGAKGQQVLAYERDGLDVAGAIFLLRQLPLKEGLPICFDVYGVRRMWRLSGSVVRREHVSLPIGEFDAWYLTGTASRLDDPSKRRDVHMWISDDAQRLPLAALGTIDLGAVRATLTAVTRPGEKPRVGHSGKEELKW